jgi:hypothetical protein
MIILIIPVLCFAGSQDDVDDTYTYYDALYLNGSMSFSVKKNGEIIGIKDNNIYIDYGDNIGKIKIKYIDFIVFDSKGFEDTEKRWNISLLLESNFNDTNVAVLFEEGGDKSLTKRIDSYDINHHGKILYHDTVNIYWNYIGVRNLEISGRILEITDSVIIMIFDSRYDNPFFGMPINSIRYEINIFSLSEVYSIQIDLGDKDIQQELTDERQTLIEKIKEITDKNDIGFYKRHVEKAHEHTLYLSINTRWDIGFGALFMEIFGNRPYAFYTNFNYTQIGVNLGYWKGKFLYIYIGLGHIPFSIFEPAGGETFYGEVGLDLQKPLSYLHVNDYFYPMVTGSISMNYMYIQPSGNHIETSFLGLNYTGMLEIILLNRFSLFLKFIFFFKMTIPEFDVFYFDAVPSIGMRFYI